MVRIFATSANAEGSSRARCRPVAAIAVAATIATAGALVLTAVTPANAGVASQTRYVRIDGDDVDNDCLNLNTPCATVQHAVDEANSGDTVDIGPGTFAGAEADKDLTITGAGVGQTTLQAPEDLDDVLTFSSEVVTSCTVKDLTIQGGSDDGIYMSNGGDLTVDDVSITGGSGDGIRIAIGGDLTVADASIANVGGDGIYTSGGGDLTVEHTSIADGAGAGVQVSVPRDFAIVTPDVDTTGNVTIANSAITGNGTSNSPGVEVDESAAASLTLTNDSIADNGAGVATEDIPVTISGSTISGNAVAGIFIAGATLDMSNSTVAANPADNAVPTFGAVDLAGGGSGPASATITDSTISASASGKGVVTEPLLQPGLVRSAATISGRRTPAVAIQATNSALLTGTIVLAPGESVACDDGSGGITDGGYNIASDGSCPFTDPTSQNSTDPSLGALADNGGPTLTMLPGSESPAIDKIPPTSDSCLSTDQRGDPRPVPVNGLCDIGAVEVQTVAPPGQPQPKTTPVVTLTAAPPGGTDPGQAVTLTATVTGTTGAPTGTVDFTNDGMAISPACSAAALTTTDNVTSATCEIAGGITAGVHSFTATYSGDVNYTSAADTLTYPPGTGGGVKPRIIAHVHSKVHRHHGWYRKSVRIAFTCLPGSAPLVPPCPPRVHLRHNGAGQVVSRTIKDTAGESASVTVVINIDKRRPTVGIRGLHHHHVFAQAPMLSCVAHDRLSGVASCHLRQRVTSPDRRLIHKGRALVAHGERLVADGHAVRGQALIARGQHLIALGMQRKVVHVVAIAKDKAGNVHRRHARYDLST